jgi:hypothetical protein
MSDTQHLNRVLANTRTATIWPEIAPGRSACRFIDDDYRGSKWEFTRRQDPTGIYYEPLRPIRDEQTVPSMMEDGPLTIASDFFSPTLRAAIAERKDFSRDSRDWYLKEMKIITHDGDEMPDPSTIESPSDYPVRLTFEVPNSNISNLRFTVEAVKGLCSDWFLP